MTSSRHALLSTAALLALMASAPALAQMQSAPTAGMKHMSFNLPEEKKPEAAPVAPSAAPETAVKPAEPAKAEEARPAERKVLTPEEALRKPDDLETWPHISSVILINSQADLDKMVALVEADPGAVPPQALFFLAKTLAGQQRMEEAALYFYVGQLRLSFDGVRWPAQPDPADVKRLAADKKKTQDQSQVTGSRTPAMFNPHESIGLLAATIGAPISSWMMEDPARAEVILKKVQTWDETAPYEYLPGYDVPPSVPYEQWKSLLMQTRTGFFARMNEFIGGLKKYKQQ